MQYDYKKINYMAVSILLKCVAVLIVIGIIVSMTNFIQAIKTPKTREPVSTEQVDLQSRDTSIKRMKLKTGTKFEDVSINNLIMFEESPEKDFIFDEYESGLVAVKKYIGEEDIVIIPEFYDGHKVSFIAPSAFFGTKVKAVVLADTVTSVSIHAFLNCKKLEVFVAGKNLEIIDESAFRGCTGLRILSLNEGLKEIGNSSFLGCTSLKTVDIPSSVETIYKYAFSGIYDPVILKGDKDSVVEEFARTGNNLIFRPRTEEVAGSTDF